MRRLTAIKRSFREKLGMYTAIACISYCLLYMLLLPVSNAPHNPDTTRDGEITALLPEKDPTGSHKLKNFSSVLIISYPNSGHELLGQALNINPDVFYWHESLTQFYSQVYAIPPTAPPGVVIYKNYDFRCHPQWEKIQLASYLLDLYTCNLTSLPAPVLGNPPLMKYSGRMTRFLKCFLKNSRLNARIAGNEHKLHQKFIWDLTCKDISEIDNFCYRTHNVEPRCPLILESIRKWSEDVGPAAFLAQLAAETGLPAKKLDGDLDHFMTHQTCQDRVLSTIHYCLEETGVQSACSQSPARVINAVRLKMINIDTILEKLRDLKVIHFLRDPRSIAYNKMVQGRKNITFIRDFVKVTADICVEMSRDVNKRREYEKIYADKFIEIRYEDLFLDSAGTLEKIFAHIDLPSAADSVAWLKERTAKMTMNSFMESGRDDLLRLATTVAFNEKCHFIMSKF